MLQNCTEEAKAKHLKMKKCIYDELIHDLCVVSVEITKFSN